ncbi:MAG TPA: efflux RND transporter permease subunit, partial [Chthonomonadales bacterium]|nr:efflux RND transporter permease subunit [Chthonomonadales bacterium]
ADQLRAQVEAERQFLPLHARAPAVAKLDINALPSLYLGLTSPGQNLQQLRALVDNTIKPRIERVPGVASVKVVGGRQREIDVAVDPLKLQQYGLTVEDVVNSVGAAGRDIAGGDITYRARQTDVRLSGAYTSLGAIRSTQILNPPVEPTISGAQASSAGADPATTLPSPALTVADVATVSDARAEQESIERINGSPGVSLLLNKAPDANTVTVVEDVLSALDRLHGVLPEGLKVVVLRNDAEVVRAALNDVDASLILGAVLATVVVLLFLQNLRGTVLVSLAIPACMVATFLVMWVVGFTLNQMTLLALSLSVGILVDDSIVVLESITRRLNLGDGPLDAALRGRAEIGFADITTTLVDVVVFVPIAFMGGIVGGFFKEFGLTIAVATLFSLVVSFSVTPMLAARWYRTGEQLQTGRGTFAALERFYKSLEVSYRQVIRWALGHRKLVILSGLTALVLIFVLAYFKLGFEFMPGADQGQIAINIELPPGTGIVATDAVALAVEKRVRALHDVAAIVTDVGDIQGGFGAIPQHGPQFAQVSVRLKPKGGLLDRLAHPLGIGEPLRVRSDQSIASGLRPELSRVGQAMGARITTAAVRSVVGSTSPIDIELRGSDITRLAQFATSLSEGMKSVTGVLDPDVSVRSGQPEARV